VRVSELRVNRTSSGADYRVKKKPKARFSNALPVNRFGYGFFIRSEESVDSGIINILRSQQTGGFVSVLGISF